MTGGEAHLRALYICYLSLEDPLVETQVVSYLEGLARAGHRIHLLTFETTRSRVLRKRWRRELATRGIAWHSVRYHKRFSLLATAYDVAAGVVTGLWLMRRHGLSIVHARSHVPAAIALGISRFRRVAMIFDIRGLMAEEYVDARRWPDGGIAYRVTKAVERRAIDSAAGIVVLTQRVRAYLFPEADDRVVVIPCCADLRRLRDAKSARDHVRERLGLCDRPVLVYVGKFGGWYLEGAMVDFFIRARAVIPSLHFLVLTQSDQQIVADQFAARGCGSDDFTITRAPAAEVGRFLAAADLAIAFIEPSFSKMSSSPTKVGEYLGAGLPVVATRGVGDLDRVLGRPGIGLLVDLTDPRALEDAAEAAAKLVADGRAEERRSIAESAFSLERRGIPLYLRLYRQVATRARANPSRA